MPMERRDVRSSISNKQGLSSLSKHYLNLLYNGCWVKLWSLKRKKKIKVVRPHPLETTGKYRESQVKIVAKAGHDKRSRDRYNVELRFEGYYNGTLTPHGTITQLLCTRWIFILFNQTRFYGLIAWVSTYQPTCQKDRSDPTTCN